LKTVFSNSDRRSYKKIISKEVMALKSIRISKHLSQDQASAICGYSRPTIGHIENGRIELSVDRINFILKCYGATYAEFEVYLKSEEQKYEIQDRCIKKLKCISDEKLKVLLTILEGF
jgi:transcriptional regulator with XRE-family HTH domain